ncbi:MAG TPA: hypothetical protein VMF65_07435 [Acidimicrobiales bacterium]|nr:hypothetical protein [Acidimicrobiales bacterium]
MKTTTGQSRPDVSAGIATPCGGGALCGWSPPSLFADTKAKRLVDRVIVGAVPALVVLAVVVALLNVAPHLPLRAALVLVGLAALAAGGWCSLNFWRCRHAHCLVTGPGWLGFGVFCFAEAGVGHSLIGGYEQPAFLGILALGVAFEAGWRSVTGTNAVTLARPLPAKEPML